MSNWTQIHKLYRVDTIHQTKKMLRYVNHRLENAPKITGSEGNAEIKIIIPDGYNGSWQGINYQTHVVIVFSEMLRDRFRDETEKELNAFEDYITKELGWEILVDHGGVW